MACIIDLVIAERTASALQEDGVCTHPSAKHSPIGMAEHEADDLERFDPDAYQKLQSMGATVYEIEIEDFEQIGALAHVPVISTLSPLEQRKLFKHAIALRLDRDLIIASACPDTTLSVALARIFGNRAFEY